MKAMLLSAGYGSRLKPITDKIPKCLVEVNNETMLDHWLKKLVSIGCKDVLINTHYLHDIVKSYLNNSVFQEYININIVHEPILLGTAGSVIKNKDFLSEDDNLIIHTDNYTSENLEKLLMKHCNRPRECHMTMMTFTTDEPKECGIVELDEGGYIKEFYEKSKLVKGNRANAAIYCIDKLFINQMESIYPSVADLSREAIPKLKHTIQTYHTSEVVIDIGNMERLLKARRIFIT